MQRSGDDCLRTAVLMVRGELSEGGGLPRFILGIGGLG
jgi:hypothetical protein